MKHYLLNRLAALMTLVMIATWPLVSSATPTLSINPPSQGTNVGDSFSLNVSITTVTDLFAYQFDVAFDPSVLVVQDITEGAFLSGGGSTFFLAGTIDNVAGSISFTVDTLVGLVPGVNGSGVLAQLEFSAIATGASSINLSDVILLDSALMDISANIIGGAVQIQGGAVPEPASLWLVASGIGWLAVTRFRKWIATRIREFLTRILAVAR